MTTTAHGRVTTHDGWPIPGARVTLIDPVGAQMATAPAGVDGSFELAGLVPGAATMLVAAPGHEPAVRSVTVPDGPWSVGAVTLARTGATALPPAGIWAIDPTHSSVHAQARHLGLSTIRGGFEDFAGIITVDEHFERSSTQVQIQAASINTGNATRDGHLRSGDFLDVEHFPQLTYASDRVERRGAELVVVGELTMLGVARPVNLTMTYQGSGPDPWGGTRAGFSATTMLHRADFAMNWNQAVGLGIDALGTSLRIAIEVEAVLQT